MRYSKYYEVWSEEGQKLHLATVFQDEAIQYQQKLYDDSGLLTAIKEVEIKQKSG